MRLRYSAACCLAFVLSPVMAQSSIDTAQELQAGDNTYASTRPCYWQYTSPAEQATLLTLTPLNGSNLTAYLADGTQPAQTQVMEYYEAQYYVLVGGGERVYLAASGGYGQEGACSGFTAALQVNANLDQGHDPDHPIVLTDGGQYMISNGTQTTDDGPIDRFLAYTPTLTGTLVLGSSNYAMLRYATQQATTWQTVVGQYTSEDRLYHFDIPVSEGEPVMLQAEVQAGNVSLLHATLVPQGAGDGSKPASAFTLGEANTVPAHFGTYWYRYDATQTGYMVLSSTASMPGGQVNYYGPSSAYAQYSSRQGGFDLRFPVSEGMSYYLTVDKVESTQDETPFTARFEPAQPGDSYENPVVVTFDAAGRAQFTTPAYSHQTYYYAVDMQDADDVFELRVHCTTPAQQISAQSQLNVYPYGNMYYGSGLLCGGQALTTGTLLVTDWRLAQGNGSTVPAGRYLICIDKYEHEPLTFAVERSACEAGNVLTNPIVLTTTGEYEIPARDDVYYAYTAPQAGRLVLKLDDPQLACTFYKDQNPISVSQQGLSYTLRVLEGETYAFRIQGAGEGLYTFTLEMQDYAPGESVDTPLLTDGDITLGDEEVDAWYRYEVSRDGVLVLTANLTDHDVAVGYVLNHQPGTGRVAETSIISAITETEELRFGAELPIHAGDVVTIHVRTSIPQPGLGVQLSVRDYELGETLDNPYVLTSGQKLSNLRWASRQLPTYVRVPVQRGSLRILSDILMVGSLYDSAELQTEVGTFTGSHYVYDASGVFVQYYLDATVSQDDAADYYLVLTSGGGQASGLTLTLVADDQALGRVKPEEGKRIRYDLMGRRVENGQWIIENGQLTINN